MGVDLKMGGGGGNQYIFSFKSVKNSSNWSKALLSFFVFLRFEL